MEQWIHQEILKRRRIFFWRDNLFTGSTIWDLLPLIVSSARNKTISWNKEVFLSFTLFVVSGHFVENPLGGEGSGKQNVDANNVAARPDDGHPSPEKYMSRQSSTCNNFSLSQATPNLLQIVLFPLFSRLPLSQRCLFIEPIIWELPFPGCE